MQLSLRTAVCTRPPITRNSSQRLGPSSSSRRRPPPPPSSTLAPFCIARYDVPSSKERTRKWKLGPCCAARPASVMTGCVRYKKQKRGGGIFFLFLLSTTGVAVQNGNFSKVLRVLPNLLSFYFSCLAFPETVSFPPSLSLSLFLSLSSQYLRGNRRFLMGYTYANCEFSPVQGSIT